MEIKISFEFESFGKKANDYDCFVKVYAFIFIHKSYQSLKTNVLKISKTFTVTENYVISEVNFISTDLTHLKFTIVLNEAI